AFKAFAVRPVPPFLQVDLPVHFVDRLPGEIEGLLRAEEPAHEGRRAQALDPGGGADAEVSDQDVAVLAARAEVVHAAQPGAVGAKDALSHQALQVHEPPPGMRPMIRFATALFSRSRPASSAESLRMTSSCTRSTCSHQIVTGSTGRGTPRRAWSHSENRCRGRPR